MVLGVRKKSVIFLASLVISLITVLTLSFNSNDHIINAANTTAPERTITLTKVWANDTTSDRPPLNGLKAFVRKSTSTLLAGPALNSAMINLAGGSGNIYAINAGTKADYEAVANPITVQSAGLDTYMWYENNTIYYYSEADNIYLNPISTSAFDAFSNLTDISGLSNFNTTFVTSMAFMFRHCNSLADISPLSNWDVGNVTSMRMMFSGRSSTDQMSIDDLSPLAGWNTQSVMDMNQMFKGNNLITSVSPIAGWNVKNVRDMQQMFNGTRLTTARVLDVWEPVRVGASFVNINGTSGNGSFLNMFNNNINLSTANMPQFTGRSGQWNTSGTLQNPTPAALTDSAPIVEKVPTDEQKECTIWTDNGDDTWTCAVSVVDDGAIYQVWENHYGSYDSSATIDNPILNVTDSATITNTLATGTLITLEKVTTGSGADFTQYFEFDVNVYDEDGIEDTSLGRTVQIKHGEVVTAAVLPDGYSYSISENNLDYTPSYRINKSADGTPIVASTSGNNTGIVSVTPGEDQLVIFENHKLDPTKKVITITKEWIDDIPELRPTDVTVTINKTVSNLITGDELAVKMRSLSGDGSTSTAPNNTITAIVKADDLQYEAVKNNLSTNNEIQASGEKTYMWFDNGTIYIYSLADNVYTNVHMENAFRALKQLSNISGLAMLNTAYTENLARLFLDSTSISNISALAGWDVGNVTTMNLTFGGNYNSGSCNSNQIFDLTPIANWNTQSVTNMDSMFKCAASLTSLDPIADWDVYNVTNMQQMFNRAGITDASGIIDWDVTRVNNFNMTFANIPNISTAYLNLPVFTERSGSWSSAGTYTATNSAVSDPVPVDNKTPDAVNSQTSISGDWMDNGDGTWTYEFHVSDDNSKYTVWEDAVVSPSYTGNAVGQANAIDVVNDAATITNTLQSHTITIEKIVTGDLALLDQEFDYSVLISNHGVHVHDYVGIETIKHGESVSFKIPVGYAYDITETAAGYNASYEIKQTSDDTVLIASTPGATTGNRIPSTDETITFTNDKTGTPVTGAFYDLQPFRVAISIMIGFGVSFVGFVLIYKYGRT